MSKTPLTDAFILTAKEVHGNAWALYVPGFARSLELQVTSLTAKNAELGKSADFYKNDRDAMARLIPDLEKEHAGVLARLAEKEREARAFPWEIVGKHKRLTEELAEARRDSEGVDWLEKVTHSCEIEVCPPDESHPIWEIFNPQGDLCGKGSNFRAAIDEAMQPLPPAPTK